ncbi:hypothetical protein NMY22_g302 [Coprinellus aureogranulatus]|nr:hypothetical protein NMY22_g302 [Coprinellus aureogranulatus]
MVFGSDSVKPDAIATTNWKPKGKPNGVKWGLKECTPGFLATIWTLAAHLHQIDQALDAVGKQSGFRYRAAHCFYKRYIIKALNNDATREAMRNLIAYYNAIIFPNCVADPADVGGDDEFGEDEDMNAALDAMTNQDCRKSASDRDRYGERWSGGAGIRTAKGTTL